MTIKRINDLTIMTRKLLLLFTILLTALTSCDDFLDIEPTGKVIAKTAAEYREMLTDAYGQFPRSAGLTTFRTDEFWMDRSASTAEDLNAYLDIWLWNDNEFSDTSVEFDWRSYYHIIYIANYLIAKQGEITQGTKEDISQMVGEAYMLRAYCHFQLANLYAQPYTHCQPGTTLAVPLSLEPDVNAVLSRSSLDKVYSQVIADAAEAESHLNVETWGEGLNYRFNKLSAKCLMARAYLYMGQYDKALETSEKILAEKNALQDMSTLLPNHYKSVENIVALEYAMPTDYQKAGRVAPGFFALYKNGDLRKSKYFKQQTASNIVLTKGGSNEYRCSFRIGEICLTAAECAVRTGNIGKARERMHQMINARYQATEAARQCEAFDKLEAAAALSEILSERARELAFEGHRWFDLRRMETQQRPTITHTFTQGSETSTSTLTPDDERYTLRIPASAVNANPEGLGEVK